MQKVSLKKFTIDFISEATLFIMYWFLFRWTQFIFFQQILLNHMIMFKTDKVVNCIEQWHAKSINAMVAEYAENKSNKILESTIPFKPVSIKTMDYDNRVYGYYQAPLDQCHRSSDYYTQTSNSLIRTMPLVSIDLC